MRGLISDEVSCALECVQHFLTRGRGGFFERLRGIGGSWGRAWAGHAFKPGNRRERLEVDCRACGLRPRRTQLRIVHSFDLLRIVAASLVVFSHSFIIAEGVEAHEPAQKLVGEILGVYGVFVFFMLSGYMVSESAARTGDLFRFVLKRAARILPLFVACNLAIVVLICPLFAEHGARYSERPRKESSCGTS